MCWVPDPFCCYHFLQFLADSYLCASCYVCGICSLCRCPLPSSAPHACTVPPAVDWFTGLSEAVSWSSFRCSGLDLVGSALFFLSTSFYVRPSMSLFFPVHLMFVLLMRRLSLGGLPLRHILGDCLLLQFVRCVVYIFFNFVICAFLICAV